jgi:hypothetical protein
MTDRAMPSLTVTEEAHAMPRSGPYRPVQGRRRAHRPISLEGPPTAQELAQQPHTGEEADRLSLYRPDQIDIDTRTVRLDITFRDVARFREQAEMVVACMQEIIRLSKSHDLGSIKQRIYARMEADSLRRALAKFNGKKPRTNTWQDR